MKRKVKFTLLLLLVATLSSFGQQQGQVDQRLLVGEWSRTGTPCLIKITEALDGGKLEVSYFDSKSITIGKAYWTQNDVILSLYVELMDAINPGSYYKLDYNPKRDLLVGIYFQVEDKAVQEVEFVRTKQ